MAAGTIYGEQPRKRIYPGTPEWAAREQEAKERRERTRREYRAQLNADCPHGPRTRAIGQSGGGWWAGMQCPVLNPNCGVKLLNAAQVYREWKDSQPEPAGMD